MGPGLVSLPSMTLQEDNAGQVDAHGNVLDLPSIGSTQHKHGQCKPCAHSWRPQGCFKGSKCEFCHLCDETAWRKFRKQRTSHQRTERRRTWLNRRSGNHFRSDGCEVSSNSSQNSRDLPVGVLFDRSLIIVRKTFIEVDDNSSGSDTGTLLRCTSCPPVLQRQQQGQQRRPPQQQLQQQLDPSSTTMSVHTESSQRLDLVQTQDLSSIIGCPRAETDIVGAPLEWLCDEAILDRIDTSSVWSKVD